VITTKPNFGKKTILLYCSSAMEPRVTMQEVAKRAGVGKSTVSLALRNDPRLRPRTRQRIQRIADQLGYRTNPTVATLMAQLRSSSSPGYQSALGFVNASPNQRMLQEIPTFAEWVSGASERANQLGYSFDHFWLHDPHVAPTRLPRILSSRNIRGIIIAANESPTLPPQFDSLWKHSACVVLGIRPSEPQLHFSSNDQYATALQAIEEVRKRGYKRPGLVISRQTDELLDFRFSAGFHTGQQKLSTDTQLPVFAFQPDKLVAFRQWYETHRPDVILCLHRRVKTWLDQLGLKVPRDVALAHLDRTDDLEDWAGMNQNSKLIGASAVDLLIGQLHRNETGVPPFAKSILVQSTWVDGETVGKKEIATEG